MVRSQTPLRQVRVLIVERHDVLREVMSRALRTAGYDVVAASDRTQAVASLTRRVPDVVAIDVGADPGSIAPLLRDLRSRGPVRTIALSGWAEPTQAPEFREAGFDDLLLKPVSLEELLAAIEGTLRHATQTPS